MKEGLDILISIIEDDETIREGYRYLLHHSHGIRVLNTYRSVESALKKIESEQPDVLLLDIELPGVSGIDALPKFRKLIPETHILMLTVYEQEDKIFKALSNGASGYLTKDITPEKMVSAIKDVMTGGGPMSSHIAKMVIASFKKNDQSPLTRRETEILEEVATGKSRQRIADELYIDLETVKSHIKNIYQKLDVHSKADAIKLAKDNKYI